MKTINSYQCETCEKIFLIEEACKQHEEACKWEKLGHAVWIENGEIKHSEKIPSTIFGPHEYGNVIATSDCVYGCGCWTGNTRSGGPVDPFGPCPKNMLPLK